MRESNNAKLPAAGLFVTLMVLVFAPAVSLGLDGAGTQASPFLIQTPLDYDQLATNPGLWAPNIYFRVTADIDLTGFPFTQPIGRSSTPFRGIFDGDGHTISNFTCNHTGRPEVGFFGFVYGPDAKVENLHLSNPVINTGNGNTAGALVARVQYATIENCHVSGGSVTAGAYVGGLIAHCIGADIIGCSVSRCDVSGTSAVGGLVGFVEQESAITNCSSTAATVSGLGYTGGFVGRIVHDATIADSYSSNNVTGQSYLGGFAGYCINAVKIDRCFATGDVEGRLYIGGFAGYSGAGLSNCYATGSASATAPGPVGGFVGTNAGGLIELCYSIGRVQTSASGPTGGLVAHGAPASSNSFWDQTTSQQPTSVGGTGLPTPQMKTAATYLAAGWDFVDETANGEEDIWRMPVSGGYPILPATKEPYPGGSGTAEDPYQIWDANDMQAIGADPCDWDKYFILMADIDMSAYTGAEYNIIELFTGVFDGNDHVIRNFTYVSDVEEWAGLFGETGEWWPSGSRGLIKDLTLENVYIDVENGHGVGALAADNEGTIINCHVTGYISGHMGVGGLAGGNSFTITDSSANVEVSGIAYVGGLIGGTDEDSHTMVGCWSAGSVTGETCVGGLAGYNSEAHISNSYSNANVSGIEYVGGLVGINEISSGVSYCYATGVVTGDSYVGGLIGYNDYYNDDDDDGGSGVAWRCYATGDVAASVSYGGGLVGYNIGRVYESYATGNVSGGDMLGGLVGAGGRVDASFWDVNTSGLDYSGAGVGKTTAQMQTKSTFTDAGWDFVGETVNGPEDIWDICEGTNYPKFVWQIPLGDFVCPDGVNFFDFSFFAGHWAEDNCAASNDCDGTDLDLLGSVDIKDLRIFADNWLAGL